MRVHGADPFRLVFLGEVPVTNEDDHQVRFGNTLVKILISDLAYGNTVSAEKHGSVAVAQSGLDGALKQVSTCARRLPILGNEADVDAQVVWSFGSSGGARILLLDRVGIDRLLIGVVAPCLLLRVLGDVLSDGVGAREIELGPPPAIEDDGERAARVPVEAGLELAQVLVLVAASDCRQDCVDGCLAVVVEKIADRTSHLRVSLRQILKAIEDSADCACGKGTLRRG